MIRSEIYSVVYEDVVAAPAHPSAVDLLRYLWFGSEVTWCIDYRFMNR